MLLGTDSRALRKNQKKEETPQSPLISDDRHPKGPKAPPARNPGRSTKYRTKIVVRNAPKRSANGFERKSTMENYIYLVIIIYLQQMAVVNDTQWPFGSSQQSCSTICLEIP